MPTGSATEYPWFSEVVYVARLHRDGKIESINAALEAAGLGDLNGAHASELVTLEQQAAFRAWLEDAGPEWSASTFALRAGAGIEVSDRRTWARVSDDGAIELIAEPDWAEHGRLVTQVLQLNDDLIDTQRSLTRRRRELERATANAADAGLRVERRMTETFVRSLLPQRLPAPRRLELAARYRTRGELHLARAGDFYDAFTLPGGAVGLAVGDVAGEGLGAVSAMARLRGGLHAFAMTGAPPSEVLLQLGRLAEAIGELATAVYVVLDPSSGLGAIASAGHPPPLLMERGRVRSLPLPESASALLGVGVEKREQAMLRLAPGATLLLYTDGLVERGHDLGRALLEAAQPDRAPLELVLDQLLASLARDGAHRDDAAVLAVRRIGRGVDPVGRIP